MKYLLLFLSFNVSACNFFGGVGDVFDADRKKVYALFIGCETESKFKFEITKVPEHSNTAWWEDHPEWRGLTEHLDIIEEHYKFAVTYKPLEFEALYGKFFYEGGLVWTSEKSSTASTTWNIIHRLGYQIENVSIHFRHGSNTGLRDDLGENRGFEFFGAQYSTDFDLVKLFQ